MLFLMGTPLGIFAVNPNVVNVSAAQQNGTCKGVVKDTFGEPVIGASVVVKGTANGGITDLDGHFNLSGVKKGAVLQISYVGYMTQEVKFNGQALNIILKEDTQLLDDVVVIGYGTAKRKDFTGSVASVKLEDSPIALTNNLNALEALKGNVSGLNIGVTNSAGGEPGMQIRGQKSISGSNSPLIVVDGAVYLGELSNINPNDIASFDVLKDATSAAAYGSRSANGVIVITTKRGHSQKPVITLNASGSMQMWANRPEIMTPEQYIETVNARNSSSSDDLSWLTPQELANKEVGKTVNWLDEVSRTGWVQDYQLSVSGSAEKVNYYLSGSYSDNQGIVVGDDYNRLSFMGKMTTDITKWLQVGVNVGYTKQDYSGAGASLSTASELSPYGVLYRDEAQGLLEKYPTTQGTVSPLWGVLGDTRDNIDKRDNFRINTFAIVKCPWLPNLTYRVNYSYDEVSRKEANFYYESYYVSTGAFDDETRYSPSTYQRLLSQANGSMTNYKTKSWLVDHILNYKETFGKHSVDLTAVATRDRTTYDYVTTTGSDFAANGNTTLGLGGLPMATVHKINMNGNERSNVGYLARAMYSFDDRYFLTASYRRDGASVFGDNNKWGDYSAFGLAWKVTNERFFPIRLKENILNDMKLKFSWGKNGNQGISPYGTFSTVSNGQKGGTRYEFGDSEILYGLSINGLGNKSLGWESTTALNIGFESAWLKNRIFLDVEVYYSQTKDQIFNRTIPVMTGFSGMKASMGQVDNRGIEVNLKTVNVQTKDFNWTTNLIFWLNRNKLVHLYGEDLDGDGKEDDDVASSLFIGKPLGAIYGYRQDGIVQEDDTEYIQANGVKAGTPKYVDLNDNGKIDSGDREILGYSSPNFRLNMSNTISYKNFELYFMLTGTFGGNGYYLQDNHHAYMINGTSKAGSNGIYVPWWTPENRSNKYTSPTFSGDGRFLGLQNRGFVRLQDITLSYNFNNQKLKDFGVTGLKLFLSGKNLATFTNWEGDDPETGAGVRSGTYPVLSSLTLGANISF